MSADSLLLVGAGGHARACIDVIEREGRFRVAGLVGLPGERGRDVLGYPVLGGDEDLGALAREHAHALVCIGQLASPQARIAAFERLRGHGFALPSIVSPAALVSRHASIGIGSIVMHGAVVNAGARVGANCIVNSRALVEHDAAIGDHCHLSTAAVANGGVVVGEGSFIGSGSVLREGIVVGRGCVVGMGLALRRSLPDGARYLGEARR